MTLVAVARWGLHPHLEVFGDGKAALRDATDAAACVERTANDRP